MKRIFMILISVFLSGMLALSGADVLNLENKTMNWSEFFSVFLSFGFYIELVLLLIINVIVESPSKLKKTLLVFTFIASLTNLADHELNLLLTNLEDKKINVLREQSFNKTNEDQIRQIKESLKVQYKLLEKYQSINFLTKSEPIQKYIKEQETKINELQKNDLEVKKSEAESIAWKQFIRMMIFYLIFQLVNTINFHTFLSEKKKGIIIDESDVNIIFSGFEILESLKEYGMSDHSIASSLDIDENLIVESFDNKSVDDQNVILKLKQFFSHE